MRALDIIDPDRTVALFHADDPVFLASSHGEIVRTMKIVSEWSRVHGATFHVSKQKTVVFRVGGLGPMHPVPFELSPSRLVDLETGLTQKWLGWMWNCEGVL